MDELHQPDHSLTDPAALLLDYLDFYRAVIVRKIDGLSDSELRSSRVPSGWTPLELVKHLIFMERRWLRWGYLAEQVAEPFGDEIAEDKWGLRPGDTAAALIEAMLDGGRRTREIVTGTDLASVAPYGGRFSRTDQTPPPSLLWILQHVFEEYARHAGHLDIARELIDGTTGET
jgi:hypothetical protein